MQKTIDFPQTPAAKGLVAAVTLSLLLLFAGLPTHAQTDHSGGSSAPRTDGNVPLPKGATTDKGTYTSQDTVGQKATRNMGTGSTYGNTRDMQDGKAGGVQDTTRGGGRTSTSTQGNRTGTYGNTSTGTGLPLDTTHQEGGQYGNSGNTGTRPRQDTLNPSRNGAGADTLDGGGKASHESGSRTQNGAQLNRNRIKSSGGSKQQ